MADYLSHVFFSMFVVVLIAFGVNYYFKYIPFGVIDWIILIPIIIFYAMLPDIDHASSKIRGFIFMVFSFGFIAILGSIIYLVWNNSPKEIIYINAGFGILQAILTLIILSTKQRGAIHSIGAGAIFAIPLLYFFSYNWLYYLVGWLAFVGHIVLDGEIHK